MTETEKRLPKSLTVTMIAPCGMNCGLCSGYLRAKKQCPGCRGEDELKPTYCVACRIKTCEELAASKQRFCHSCAKFPCTRLRQLDKRYRTKYGMSMIENLETIREIGIDEFVTRERTRWTCPECGSLLCVHKEDCMVCGHAWSQTPAHE
ncbi:DUF3795 domain-containing protein [Candidatus Bipolaricaulota bacterium]